MLPKGWESTGCSGEKFKAALDRHLSGYTAASNYVQDQVWLRQDATNLQTSSRPPQVWGTRPPANSASKPASASHTNHKFVSSNYIIYTTLAWLNTMLLLTSPLHVGKSRLACGSQSLHWKKLSASVLVQKLGEITLPGSARRGRKKRFAHLSITKY